TCSGGVCSHQPNPSCVACTTAADCSDGNLCTAETCTGGVCGSQPVASCSACTTAADCDDSNPCTTDTCAAGVCHSQPIDGCTSDGGSGPAGGGTGTGGGTVPGTGGGSGPGGGGDAGHAPGHPAEICGDCVDNDGDGLVDYEDPDCCERIDPLTLSRMMMRMRSQGAGDSLRLRSRGVAASSSLDPRDGVTLQL